MDEEIETMVVSVRADTQAPALLARSARQVARAVRGALDR